MIELTVLVALMVGVELGVVFLTRKDFVRRNERRKERRRNERKILAAVDEALPCLVALAEPLLPTGVPI